MENELLKLKEKVEVYEKLLHSIQMYACWTLDQPPLDHLMSIIFDWSYAHRCGNGELSDEEQNDLIDFQFERMKNHEWKKSCLNSGIETEFRKQYNDRMNKND